VQSTSKMPTASEFLNVFASLSQSGFSDLQWPHHGARNLTNAPLPELNTSWSKFFGVSSLVALARERLAMATVTRDRDGAMTTA